MPKDSNASKNWTTKVVSNREKGGKNKPCEFNNAQGFHIFALREGFW